MKGHITPFLALLWVVFCITPIGVANAEQPLPRSAYDGGEVVVAVPRDFPPYYQVAPDGRPTGFAIETMDAIAGRAGLNLKYQVYDNWNEVWSALKTGQAHVVPNMGILPERREYLNFTPVLEQFQVSIFVPMALNKQQPTRLPKGARVATTHTNAARKALEERHAYELALFDDTNSAIDAALKGTVDAVALPEPIVFAYLSSKKSINALAPIGLPLVKIDRAIGVIKTRPVLFEDLSRVTTEFVASQEYEALYRKWHGEHAEVLGLHDLVFIVAALGFVSVFLVWLWRFVSLKFIVRSSLDAVVQASHTARRLSLRVMLLAAMTFGGILLAAFTILYLHFQHAQGQTKALLLDSLAGQVEIIRSFATLPTDILVQVDEEHARQMLITRLQAAQARFVGIGEITIAEKAGDNIRFVLRQRHWNRFAQTTVPLSSAVAEPMKQALSGERGIMIGRDYRGEPVLAAYDHVDTLGLGIVYKMDVADVRAPHYRMAIYASIFSFVIALLVALVYLRAILPVIREIQIKEAQFNGFRDHAQAIMFVSEPDSTLIEVNDAYCRLFGATREELLGDKGKLNLSAQDYESFRAQNRTIVETGRPLDIRQALTIKGGEHHFLTKKFPLTSPDGTVYAIGAVAVDVTDLHDTETALIESEERFRSTFEQAAVGIAHLSLDGQWMLVNDVLCRIAGYSRDEMCALSYQDITHTDDLAIVGENLQKLRDQKIDTWAKEARLIHKGGETTWVNITMSLVRDHHGKPSYFIAVIQDINARIADRTELARQRDRLRGYLDLAGTLIIALNGDGEIVIANKYACDFLGYTEEQLLGQNWFDLAIPLENRDEIREVAAKILHGDLDEVAYFENEIITKSGQRRLIGWNNTYLHEPGGAIETLLSSGIDITDTQKTLSELKRTNRFLKTISRCNEVLVHTNNQQQLLRDICRLIVEEGEYSLSWVSFIRGEDEPELIPVERYGVGRDAIDDCMKAFSSTHVLGANHPIIAHDVIKEVCTPNNEGFCEKHGLQSLCALPLMEDGEPFGALFIVSQHKTSFNDNEIKLLSELANDLAFGIMGLRKERERQRALENLSISEERSRAIIENAHDAIISVDSHGLITQFNPAAESMFGLAYKDIIGQKPEDYIIPERFRTDHTKGFKTFVEAGSSSLFGQALNLFGLKADGNEFPIELTLSPMTGDTNDVCTAVIRDTSDRYEAERQRRQAQNMESLGNLAGGMAHDINNMLLPIINLTAMVRRTMAKGSGENKKLAMVEQAAERVKDLVNNILIFSRQEEPELEDLSIHDVLKAALNLIRPTTPATITIQESIDPFDGIVHVDQGQITAALINLFGNAADAMGGHVGQIELKLQHIKPSSDEINRRKELSAIDYAKITVTDTGVGMTPEILARALDPFFTTKPPGQGTGLGLPMVSGIIAKHNGVMEINSSPGHGTCIEIYLPIELRHQKSLAKAKAKSTSKKEKKESLT